MPFERQPCLWAWWLIPPVCCHMHTPYECTHWPPPDYCSGSAEVPGQTVTLLCTQTQQDQLATAPWTWPDPPICPSIQTVAYQLGYKCIVRNSAEHVDKVKINYIHYSPLVYKLSYFTTEVNQVGEVWLTLDKPILTVPNHFFSFMCLEMLFQEDSTYDFSWDRSYAELPSAAIRHQWHKHLNHTLLGDLILNSWIWPVQFWNQIRNSYKLKCNPDFVIIFQQQQLKVFVNYWKPLLH